MLKFESDHLLLVFYQGLMVRAVNWINKINKKWNIETLNQDYEIATKQEILGSPNVGNGLHYYLA